MTKPLGLPVYFLRELTFEIAQKQGFESPHSFFCGKNHWNVFFFLKIITRFSKKIQCETTNYKMKTNTKKKKQPPVFFYSHRKSQCLSRPIDDYNEGSRQKN